MNIDFLSLDSVHQLGESATGRSRGFGSHGVAGVSWSTAPRLRNGVALQGDTPLIRLCSSTGLQASTHPARTIAESRVIERNGY